MSLVNITGDGAFEFQPLEFKPLEILNTITALISALADVLIILTIARYNIMKTRPNIYLANWCICNFLLMSLVPVSLNLFGIMDSLSIESTCVWVESEYGMLFGNLLFVLELLVDWYLVTYTKQTCSVHCKQIHLFVISVIWIVTVSVCIASVSFCILDWSYPLTLVCFIIGYFIVFAAIVLVYILRFVKIVIFKQKLEKSKIELAVVTSYLIIWLPYWFSMFGQIYLHIFLSDTFMQLTHLAGYSHGWVMLILLYCFDKAFKLHLRKIFGLSRQRTDSVSAVSNKEQSAVLL